MVEGQLVLVVLPMKEASPRKNAFRLAKHHYRFLLFLLTCLLCLYLFAGSPLPEPVVASTAEHSSLEKLTRVSDVFQLTLDCLRLSFPRNSTEKGSCSQFHRQLKLVNSVLECASLVTTQVA